MPSLQHEELLDHPIYNSLGTDHATLAVTHGAARRFPADIGPLSGIPSQTAESYEDLRTLVDPGSVAVLFLNEQPEPMPGWSLLKGGDLIQMVHVAAGERLSPRLAPGGLIRALTPEDAPAMVELATLTEPGPFRLRTLELGGFVGVFHPDQATGLDGTGNGRAGKDRAGHGRLMAMAGRRLSLPGFVEVSAVCTHPEARGRGYAPSLMLRVMDGIRAEGKTPILHSYAHNVPAIAVYERLGFAVRRHFDLAVLSSGAGKTDG